jgi:dTDP-4-amino-4,6-dideoxygalactose transaminase
MTKEEMKKKLEVSKLAIFGGSPAFPEKLHVGRPNIGDREVLVRRLNEALDRKWLTNRGPLVQEFERTIARYTGVKHCIAMCNGTIALEIAIRALGLKGEVIVPSFTFIATAHALQWQEITPVFCDVRTSDFTLDPSRIEELITPRTTGIVGVHLWGRPCDILHIEQIARKRNLKILYDAAHSFGCSYNGRMIGCFGDAEVFSFHGTKFLNSLEGGAVVTNDDDLAKKIRLMKNFGFDGYDTVIYIGTNGKMNEFSAATGLTNFEAIDQFVEVNRRNYHVYKRELAGIPGVHFVEYNEREKCNYQYIVIIIDETKTGLDCNSLVKIFHAENVLVRRYFYPGCHQMEPYRSFFPHAKMLLPNTERYSPRVMSLPTGTSVQPEQIVAMTSLLKYLLRNADSIKSTLKKA